MRWHSYRVVIEMNEEQVVVQHELMTTSSMIDEEVDN